jgi:hypothetical protein
MYDKALMSIGESVTVGYDIRNAVQVSVNCQLNDTEVIGDYLETILCLQTVDCTLNHVCKLLPEVKLLVPQGWCSV